MRQVTLRRKVLNGAEGPTSGVLMNIMPMVRSAKAKFGAL